MTGPEMTEGDGPIASELSSLGAPETVVEWARSYGSDWRRAWEECPGSDILFWLARCLDVEDAQLHEAVWAAVPVHERPAVQELFSDKADHERIAALALEAAKTGRVLPSEQLREAQATVPSKLAQFEPWSESEMLESADRFRAALQVDELIRRKMG